MNQHPLKWFTSRIGKRIWRDDNGCPCPTCYENEQKGLIIKDMQHAKYLCETQGELQINYRDIK